MKRLAYFSAVLVSLITACPLMAHEVYKDYHYYIETFVKQMHHVASIPSKNSIELEDGTVWYFDEENKNLITSWEVKDLITLHPLENQPNLKVAIKNLMANNKVLASSFKGKTNVTKSISSIDSLTVTLNDGSSWSTPLKKTKGWKVGDLVTIAGKANGYNPHYLINISKLLFTKATENHND